MHLSKVRPAALDSKKLKKNRNSLTMFQLSIDLKLSLFFIDPFYKPSFSGYKFHIALSCSVFKLH